MQIIKNVKLLAEEPGTGEMAKKGDPVVFHLRTFLNHGDEVITEIPDGLADSHPELISHTPQGPVLNHSCTLGRRHHLAAIEAALIGMREGGYRKIKAPPHLTYGGVGVPGSIPPNAVLTFEIWLVRIGYLA